MGIRSLWKKIHLGRFQIFCDYGGKKASKAFVNVTIKSLIVQRFCTLIVVIANP